ncbi:TPA: hypothetical protein N0F65_012458 [Lagenidium giganteum]|uniref:Uncharacterized protein n=1 Tax=Lagenidium giganteum TaxID=4803 RepID=A0AAV2YD24_9STRA|nr:TPA: hypothetical protein N0F65_012458 [Lagenidium giganteum]
MQARRWLKLAVFALALVSLPRWNAVSSHPTAVDRVGDVAPATTPAASSATSAVEKIAESSTDSKREAIKNIKSATDGLQLALQAAATKDPSRAFKGVGDALGAIPVGACGIAGIAFSLVASVFAVTTPAHPDPTLALLQEMQKTFKEDMDAIETSLKRINDQVSSIVTGIDKVLSEISEIPQKVVAEMKLTTLTEMKDKFAAVQRASVQYAHGNMTVAQMMGKCDDYQIAALFSELSTFVTDEKDLLSAKFGTRDHANGQTQLQLLLFYVSVVPIVTHCNALKYSLQSLEDDGKIIDQVIRVAMSRVLWYLTPPSRVVYVYEHFDPYVPSFRLNQLDDPKYHLSMSFAAFDTKPPHGQCFQTSSDSARLVPLDISTRTRVSQSNAFCVKSTATDDSPVKLAYAEKEKSIGIIQPEIGDDFDGLAGRGWTPQERSMYVPAVDSWQRAPCAQLTEDFVIIQAESTRTSVEEVTDVCKKLGDGYNRDGDAHSKDYHDGPWTIFCVKYTKRSVRDMTEEDSKTTFLRDIQWNEMDASKASRAECASGYARDKRRVTIPAKVRKQFLSGTVTVDAFAVCLLWEPLLSTASSSDYVKRVWLNDSLSMPDKPQFERGVGRHLWTY